MLGAPTQQLGGEGVDETWKVMARISADRCRRASRDAVYMCLWTLNWIVMYSDQ